MSDFDIADWRKLGAVLRQARLDAHLTQDALAGRAGVSRAWLARVEAGHRKAELEQLLRLIDALDLTLAVKPRRRSPGAEAALAALRESEADG